MSLKVITKRQKLKNDIIGLSAQSLVPTIADAVVLTADLLFIHDTGVTTDVNNKLSIWSDQSASANNAFQTVSINQPVFDAIAPTNIVTDNSVPTFLKYTASPVINKSLFIAFKYDNLAKQFIVDASTNDTDALVISMDVDTLNISFVNGVNKTIDATGLNLSGHAITNDRFMLQIDFGASSWQAKLSHSGNTTTFPAYTYGVDFTTSNINKLGSDILTINNSTIGIYEFALMPVIVSNSQSINALSYCKDRYGV